MRRDGSSDVCVNRCARAGAVKSHAHVYYVCALTNSATLGVGAVLEWSSESVWWGTASFEDSAFPSELKRLLRAAFNFITTVEHYSNTSHTRSRTKKIPVFITGK